MTTLGLALSHGANDAPKTMGIIVMGLVAAGLVCRHFEVPLWVILATAGAMALGTMLGGWRLIRTLGTRFYRVRPIHAFTSQITSGLIVILASVLRHAGQHQPGGQLGHRRRGRGRTASAKCAGASCARSSSAWLLTIPATAIAGGLAYLLLRQWFGG